MHTCISLYYVNIGIHAFIHVYLHAYWHTRALTYQSEWPEYGKPFDVSKAELNKAKKNDDDIEAVPPIVQISIETQGEDLQQGFSRKYRRKDLSTQRFV